MCKILMCALLCVQQAPERISQSDAVYEVVSLQREAERNSEGRGPLASPTEEEEADDGRSLFLALFIIILKFLKSFLSQ